MSCEISVKHKCGNRACGKESVVVFSKDSGRLEHPPKGWFSARTTAGQREAIAETSACSADCLKRVLVEQVDQAVDKAAVDAPVGVSIFSW